LCEKAYAKFSGSYTKLWGGLPCWALTELTGGIAVEIKVPLGLFLDNFLTLIFLTLNFLTHIFFISNKKILLKKGVKNISVNKL